MKNITLSAFPSLTPENFGAVSEEQGERFHQVIVRFESRFSGKWNASMLAKWYLKLLLQDTKGKQAADENTLL